MASETLSTLDAIAGDIVHVTRDQYGNILVIDDRKHRILSFDSVFEQSKVARAAPHLPVHEYNRAMLLPLLFFTPNTITVLGLGGGALAHGLFTLLPDARIEVTELRARVVEIAHDWFSLPRDERLRIAVGDAKQAISDLPAASTDLILTDLYSADRMHPSQAQRQFIKACSRALTDQGWLALNYHRMPEDDGNLLRELRRQFPCLLIYTSKSKNVVIFGCKSAFEPWPLDSQRINALEKQLPIAWRKLAKKLQPLAPAP